MRQVIISVLGILIIGGGFLGMKKMASKEKPEPEKVQKATPVVFSEIVKNQDLPITISASGNLEARDRVEIYSEVQGIFEYSAKSYKPGVVYSEGSVLIQLNSDEHKSNLRSQKSSLYNQIVGLLPDLKFDYPQSYEQWQNYITEFNIEGRLQKLPEALSENEKLFIAGKNIISSWYNVKNLEERLSKYTIHAPYDGILIEANIDNGVLVRPGQKLGEFINPNIYELEVAVNSSYANLLRVGNPVTLHNVQRTKTWNGKVNRLNSLIDPNTQTIQAYIRVNGSGLREGMYLEAVLDAKKEKNTYEIDRQLMVDNNKVFILDQDKLKLMPVETVHFTDTKAIIKGLADGTEIVNKALPGAYDGMKVRRYSE
jgi:multidrug efflux pump subunit AcrA (membrane-fusion protein)